MIVLIVLFVINLICLVIDIIVRSVQIKNVNATRKEIEKIQLRTNANMVILRDIERHMKKCGAKHPKNELEFILTRKV